MPGGFFRLPVSCLFCFSCISYTIFAGKRVTAPPPSPSAGPERQECRFTPRITALARLGPGPKAWRRSAEVLWPSLQTCVFGSSKVCPFTLLGLLLFSCREISHRPKKVLELDVVHPWFNPDGQAAISNMTHLNITLFRTPTRVVFQRSNPERLKDITGGSTLGFGFLVFLFANGKGVQF